MADRTVKVFFLGDTKGLQKAASEVGGISSKMKTALGGIGAGLGLAAVGKGLLSAADQFKDAALAANDFATASGLAVEDASRFQEVAGDLGIEAKTLEGALGRLSKGLGKDEEKWAKYGVSVARAADGTVDARKTFLGAIGALKKIEDPLKRAQVGSELFGRSWQELAPLIELGADGVAQALNDVGDAQVYDQAEVEKAKQFRDATDALNDSMQGLKFSLAAGAIPLLSTLANVIAGLDPQIVTLGLAVVGGAVAIAKLGSAVTGLSTTLSFLAAHPIFAILAGFGLIALAVVKNWDRIKEAAVGAIRAIVRAWNALDLGFDISVPSWIPFLGGKSWKVADLFPDIPEFATGGVVPGPVGMPQLALVHGGEEVLTPEQRDQGRAVVINQYVTVASTNTYELQRDLGRHAQQALRAAGRSA